MSKVCRTIAPRGSRSAVLCVDLCMKFKGVCYSILYCIGYWFGVWGYDRLGVFTPSMKQGDYPQ